MNLLANSLIRQKRLTQRWLQLGKQSGESEAPSQRVHKIGMNELDERGWTHIHHAACRGFVKSIERFIGANHEQLELETESDLRLTPLLVAVIGGNLDSIKTLVQLNANIAAVDAQQRGCVEISCLKELTDVLEYFIALDDPRLPVYRRLVSFFNSDVDEEAESTARCLAKLTDSKNFVAPTDKESTNPASIHMKGLIRFSVVSVAAKVIRVMRDSTKLQALRLLANLVYEATARKQIVNQGLLPPLVGLIRKSFLSSSTDPSIEHQPDFLLAEWASNVLEPLAHDVEIANTLVANNLFEYVLETMNEADVSRSSDADSLVSVIELVRQVIETVPRHQDTIRSMPQFIPTLLALFEMEEPHVWLIIACCKAIRAICRQNVTAQNALVDAGGARHLVRLTALKQREIQLLSVQAIHMIAQENLHSQAALMRDRADKPLLELLRKNKQEEVQEKCVAALWSIAGNHFENQLEMAESIRISTFIDFLTSPSQILHVYGCVGLRVLASGPLSCSTQIGRLGAIQPLVKLLKSNKPEIVRSSMRVVRHLCASIGFVANAQNQQTVRESRGIRQLVGLMMHVKTALIQAEAALTLAYVALDNKRNMQDVQNMAEFGYKHIMKLFYDDSFKVRLTAYSAMACFAYNKLYEQQKLLALGGVSYRSLREFIDNNDPFNRVSGAFQMVILARTVTDEQQAVCSAAGIMTLCDIINHYAEQPNSDQVLGYAADCIARLSHTRPGIPDAMIAVNVVNCLFRLLHSDRLLCRGNAAIALSQQLLALCRTNTRLIQVLFEFCHRSGGDKLHHYKLSNHFLDAWHHYKALTKGLELLPREPDNHQQDSSTDSNEPFQQKTTTPRLPPISTR